MNPYCPEERIWLDEYRQALVKQQPGAVVRMLVYGSKSAGRRARRQQYRRAPGSAERGGGAQARAQVHRVRSGGDFVCHALDHGAYAVGMGSAESLEVAVSGSRRT